MPKDPRSMSVLLQSSAVLQRIGKRLAEHQSLLDRVRLKLPPELAGHCQAAVPDGNRITLYTDSPAWASRLRYLAAELESELGTGGRTVSQVRVRVLAMPPAETSLKLPEHKAKRLSEENRRLLLKVAEGLSEPTLRAALRRLAAGGRRTEHYPTDRGRM